MKRFKVKWIEFHEAEVEARDEDYAVGVAYDENHEKTLVKCVTEPVEHLGGVCDDHGDFKGETCSECDYPDNDGAIERMYGVG